LVVCGGGLGPSRWWVRHQSGVSSRSAHNNVLYRNRIKPSAVASHYTVFWVVGELQ
jgi:hypothetical protein